MGAKYGDKIAVGCDLKDGFVATKGWKETTTESGDEFFARICKLGIKTVICTDISRDGAMMGTNTELYRSLSKKYPIDIIASGGVSSMNDIESLTKQGLYGAIIGRALYNGAIDLSTAIKTARGEL